MKLTPATFRGGPFDGQTRLLPDTPDFILGLYVGEKMLLLKPWQRRPGWLDPRTLYMLQPRLPRQPRVYRVFDTCEPGPEMGIKAKAAAEVEHSIHKSVIVDLLRKMKESE